MPQGVREMGAAHLVATVASEMRRRFGAAAIQVARTQLAHAAPDVAPRWNEILRHLGG